MMAGGRKILRSWKEIAAHLHRTDRTCQRWEREFGLPVHREDLAPQTNVYAYTDELDDWLFRKFHEPDINEDQQSVAVLPFISLESADTHEHFAEGLAAALIDVLSGFMNLRVCALTSVLSLKGKNMDVREIGQKLIVNSILEGCFQIRGNAIELSTSLANARDGFTIWAQRYAGHVDNLVAIEEDIIGNIVRTLRLRSRYNGHPAILGGRALNSEAFHLYIRGRYFHDRLSEKDLAKSITLFREALKLDDGQACIHAAMSESYVHLAFLGYRRPKEVIPEAKVAAFNALALNRAVSEALTAMAVIEWTFDYVPAEAEKHFRRALDLKPNGAEIHAWHGLFMISMGRWEDGIAELKLAIEHNPISLMVNCSVAHGYSHGPDSANAENLLRHCLALEEKSVWARHILARVYLANGNLEGARREIQKAFLLSGKSPQSLVRLACIQALTGETEEARKSLKKILNVSRQRYVDATSIAEIYAALGDYNKAFRWLGTAFKDKASNLIWIKCNPLFQKARLDPRFGALARKIGLES
ncbi:MAG: hypothetical protein WBC70_01715 [Candidatus Aminicenantales bacterium]